MAKCRKRRNKINKVFVTVIVKFKYLLGSEISVRFKETAIFIKIESVLDIKLERIELIISKSIYDRLRDRR